MLKKTLSAVLGVWTAVVLLSMSPVPLTADEVVRKDGEVLNGAVVESVPGQYLIIKTDMGRTYRVRWIDIQELNGAPVGPAVETPSPDAGGVTPTANANAVRGWVMIDLGGALPLQPEHFPKYWDAGVLIGTALYLPFTDHLTAGADAYYSFHPLNKAKYLDGIKPLLPGGVLATDIEGGGIALFSLMANLKYSLLSRTASFSPYVKAGVGLIHRSVQTATYSNGTVFTRSGAESVMAGAVQAGLGIDFNLDDAHGIFAEVKYASANHTALVPVSVGYVFRF